MLHRFRAGRLSVWFFLRFVCTHVQGLQGIQRREDDDIVIDGPQRFHAADFRVPGDPSAAAFWLAAGDGESYNWEDL